MKTAVTWILSLGLFGIGSILLGSHTVYAEHPPTGEFLVTPSSEDSQIPTGYRLRKENTPFTLVKERAFDVSGFDLFHLSFPSQVKSPFEVNNTVHAEYYRPRGKGPFPAVIILDVLAGDQLLSRTMGRLFAQNGIAGLFVQMAYYGPRRPAERYVRLLTPNLEHTSEAIRQSVVDCRSAVCWLESRPEVNPKKLGIIGTSMGSFIAGLTGAMEPRINKVALLLGGGGLVDAYFDHPRGAPLRTLEAFFPGSKERIKGWIRSIDTLTYADRLKSRNLLIIAAAHDDIVPAKAAQQLWEASGKQKIIWLNTNHYGAIAYLIPMMHHVLNHFRDQP
ncbi:alpha/beta hydrolase family protein [Tuwongella immobilis]|uniref:Dienelactone hydrolase domain-containing protein n=1 Tax=Tuwongella immobilis TaxID=692036 RepID=A0A6C2YPI8_9BACT|nr:alpha/beta hydrolase family protein [Tuwongella immobilis]VIP03314.1 Dienelactone hydrolase-like enzyme OS=Singulisphaera acidiphila (strain ATCC BAA-1392 / DSM 18658 / VKM B-2454 / MOB10) GN=Sinac_1537 PE=4 SV=1: Abhydrolase_5 [Tuwongella immobilis]VTS03999.1 Dienelactone hydrolase-like enzyme OS=Singulisphaera acidiphila (strain ATCC BAA-1392 / DSM 18658 / VKM B-2454 / MOB10) GN=Sinac_1537 PE=4 SV=1: Abhydrolase_5 [Tuwongella immobilis]